MCQWWLIYILLCNLFCPCLRLKNCPLLYRFVTMLCLKMTVNVRPGSLWILHQISHLSPRPPIRSISHAPFACDHHKTYRSHVPLRVATLPRLRPSLPLKSTICFQPCRPATTTSGTGWYESLADSTPVHLTEQLLISVHQTTGLPWWASIVCTTVALRTVVTLPLGAYQAVIIAKVCVASRTKHPIIQCVFSALVCAHTSLNRVRVELEKPWGESP